MAELNVGICFRTAAALMQVSAMVLCLTDCTQAVRSVAAEFPTKVTACQIMTDPAAFDHRLVEVSGRVSLGFEEFNLYPVGDCATRTSIWLGIGGTDDGKQAIIEGVPVELAGDTKTKEFVQVIESDGGTTTLIGRFLPVRSTPLAPGHSGVGMAIWAAAASWLFNRSSTEFPSFENLTEPRRSLRCAASAKSM